LTEKKHIQLCYYIHSFWVFIWRVLKTPT